MGWKFGIQEAALPAVSEPQNIISVSPYRARRSPRGGDRRHYVPGWPGLKPEYLLHPSAGKGLPFPLNAARRSYFYVARNAENTFSDSVRLRELRVSAVRNSLVCNAVSVVSAAVCTATDGWTL